MKVKLEGKVYIPEDMPDNLKTLIKGLITVIPSKRWGHQEVEKWLKGEYVPLYYKTFESNYEPFPFGKSHGKDVFANNPQEMANLMSRDPETGKRHLYKGRIQKWLEKANDPTFVEIENIIEREYPKDQDAGLTKAIYILNPIAYKTFSGHKCQTAEDIGDAIEHEAQYYKKYLTTEDNPDMFLYLEARDAKDVADAFRSYVKAYNSERSFNMIILDLQGRNRFKFNDFQIYKPADLLLLDDETKSKFVDLLLNPDSKLSIWIEINFPDLLPQIDKWRKLDRHNSFTLTYALLEGSPFIIFDKKAYTCLLYTSPSPRD